MLLYIFVLIHIKSNPASNLSAIKTNGITSKFIFTYKLQNYAEHMYVKHEVLFHKVSVKVAISANLLTPIWTKNRSKNNYGQAARVHLTLVLMECLKLLVCEHNRKKIRFCTVLIFFSCSFEDMGIFYVYPLQIYR